MKLIMLLVSSFFLFSCGSGLPTEEMAFKKFSEQQAKYPADKELFEYTNFKKINGAKLDAFGQEIYEMDYSVKKIAKQDLHGHGWGGCVADSKIIADSILESQKKLRVYYLAMSKYEKAYKKGELVKMDSGKINFVKKENGWE